MAHDTVAQLDAVLAAERQALLGGQYAQLAEIAKSKTALLQMLFQQPPPKEMLRHIKSRMDTNQDLIAAALQGVAAARDRISALEGVRDGLRTYDRAGQVAVVATTPAGFEKKA